ncbi:glucose-6-phosphate isomerase [Litorilituus sediminis]|uniref:Glucose-6-phosphate isomerase n=1 Tax=Litorilituus sediminis TaxID=718192 RepID=A0A4V0ZFX1_9GAMM|nr:glucose-6-phosphate isomerase [Litorilituus sediminis]QBG35280.1 glucose-6-phosphate isomerase [Litorilituus sediminis]
MDLLNSPSFVQSVKLRRIIDLFHDEARGQSFALKMSQLFLDYSKQNISPDELSNLITWARDCRLNDSIDAMFSGEKINNTEERAVLHTLLRAPSEIKYAVLGEQAQEVLQTEVNMASIVDDVRQGKLTSCTGQKFTDVLVIGIGGSYYGLKVALSALSQYQTQHLNVHVLSNVDGQAVADKLSRLEAKSTLVIVISKTFTTQETLLNAHSVKQWMLDELKTDDAISRQWFAVSSNLTKATQFGINENSILPMWDWVGGRFSIWSAVGLPLALAIGNQNFEKFKLGAYEMDNHFQQADFSDNMPVLMALLGIWNRNVLGYHSLAVLPYEHSLRAFPGYLQQIDMESNGKSVSIDGEKLSWATAPIIFGQEGTNGQHAFMQLMHQSEDIIPADFIVSLKPSTKAYQEHHKVLVANCFAQSEALMQGVTLKQVEEELKSEETLSLTPHKVMKGNTPSNTLLLESITPESIGALFALYEHKIFVQGTLWQLNPFDQWGVELGKKLSSSVLDIINGKSTQSHLSTSSIQLINTFLDANK